MCSSVTERPTPAVPSETAWCYFCGVEVWVSETLLRELVRPGKAKPACNPCAQGVSETEEVHYVIHPKQVPALAQLGLLDERRRLIDRLNRRRR